MWILDNQMGPNALWLSEFLTQTFDFKPGMRVLDLGCGKGMTSVFLAREFGVQVYAVDLWDNPDKKWENAKVFDVQKLEEVKDKFIQRFPESKNIYELHN